MPSEEKRLLRSKAKKAEIENEVAKAKEEAEEEADAKLDTTGRIAKKVEKKKIK